MKVLIILCSHEMSFKDHYNILILNDFFKQDSDLVVDYCGISCNDDFHVFEDIIQFKYKIINPKNQISKICDFITSYREQLEYDWYIKIRPDIRLLEPINFKLLSENAINARARQYTGPKKIKYGMSVGGKGVWENIKECYYDDIETHNILDDQLFIFHHNIINLGAFTPNELLDDYLIGNNAHEWSQTRLWKLHNIDLNVIGINLIFTKFNCFSGDLNL